MDIFQLIDDKKYLYVPLIILSAVRCFLLMKENVDPHQKCK